MRWQALFSICILVVGLLAACGSEGLPVLTGNSPKEVVARFWAAFEKNDQDTMLDCIDPDLRTSIDPYGSVGLYAADWLRIIFEEVNKRLGKQIIELTGTRFDEIDNNGTVAHVRAYCRIKVIDLGLVREFQLTHTLVKKGGKWYLSSPQ